MNVELFMETLPIMLKGMAGIFLVTGTIILSIIVMGKVSSDKGEEPKE